MTSFNVNPLFILDLRDDFLMNNSKKLYDFLGKDPVKAFHLGIRIFRWFELLDKKQQYLHSKALRHNREELEAYLDQAQHWTKSYPHATDDEQVNMMELSEYVFNNMLWNPDTEEEDKVKMALFLGMVIGQNAKLEDEDLLFNIH